MAKKPEEMTSDERRSAGISKKGEARKHRDIKVRGASGVKEFTCSHVGFGKFCHLCDQLKRGELVEKDGKFIPNPKHISDRVIVRFIMRKEPDKRYKGMSKQAIIDDYIQRKNTTVRALRKDLER